MGCGCGGRKNNSRSVGSGRQVRTLSGNRISQSSVNNVSLNRSLTLDGAAVERRRIESLRRRAIKDALNH